jgi:hypothetical protein
VVDIDYLGIRHKRRAMVAKACFADGTCGGACDQVLLLSHY